jgi:hypothetical protein
MITVKTLRKRDFFSSWSVNSSIPFRFNPKLDVLIQIHKKLHLAAFHYWDKCHLLLKIKQTSYHVLPSVQHYLILLSYWPLRKPEWLF